MSAKDVNDITLVYKACLFMGNSGDLSRSLCSCTIRLASGQIFFKKTQLRLHMHLCMYRELSGSVIEEHSPFYPFSP